MSNMGGVFALSFVLLLLLGNGVAEEMLFSGESLNAGEFLENGPYRFIMQTDCNLVLYMNQTRALWSSRTDGRGTSCRATLQNDGDLVVLSGTAAVWNSGTARGSNNYRLIVQGDGMLSSMVLLSGLLIQFRVRDSCSETGWEWDSFLVCFLLFDGKGKNNSAAS